MLKPYRFFFSFPREAKEREKTHLLEVPSKQIAITIISVKELIRGRLAQIRKATKPDARVKAYYWLSLDSQVFCRCCEYNECSTTKKSRKNPIFFLNVSTSNARQRIKTNRLKTQGSSDNGFIRARSLVVLIAETLTENVKYVAKCPIIHDLMALSLQLRNLRIESETFPTGLHTQWRNAQHRPAGVCVFLR
ncbi:hypothetical protein THIOM_004630 [Candidatus Thiomargarita nelsonii]|uniref:Uncharacterized protein n=1 Tax=Candidatus Thiomargarita nelsonii TaxID=1003181 RepID=A0A176RVE0_9GAMM|nr:hypothetical protein THIOM_004630 [Candidatus Thiomargarita nelsonii]